ncbi:hypothetical protein AAVH_00834 [Aphelenchoides avenae]|nr:hypothetical protein AAVH_00834 [Aphelenchus avenae]
MATIHSEVDADNLGEEVKLDVTPPPGDAFNDTSDAVLPDIQSTNPGNPSDVEVIQPKEESETVVLNFRRNSPTEVAAAALAAEEEKKKHAASKPGQSSKARLDTKEKGFDELEETIPLKHTTMLTDKHKAAEKDKEEEYDVISPETIAERERFKQKVVAGIGIATVAAIAIGLFVWYRSRH